MGAGRTQYEFSFVICPIILTGGIAENLPGGMLPIINITQAQDYEQGVTGTSLPTNLDDYFAHFRPLAGGSLIDNAIGEYPFANQRVAANAIINQPLRVSLAMTCPARGAGGFSNKFSIMGNLQTQIARHNNLGGTYTIATPSFIYADCVMVALRDVSSQDGQAQDLWQWDFEQPLLTLEEARQAQNSLMTKFTNGTYVAGDPPTPSGQQPAVGQPASTQGPSTVPAATPLIGGSVGGRVTGTNGR